MKHTIVLIICLTAVVFAIEPGNFDELVQYYNYEQEQASHLSRGGDSGEMLVERPEDYETFNGQATTYHGIVVTNVPSEGIEDFNDLLSAWQDAIAAADPSTPPWQPLITVIQNPPSTIDTDDPIIQEVLSVTLDMISSAEFQASFDEAVNEQVTLHNERCAGLVGVAAAGAAAGAGSAAGEAYGEYEVTGEVDIGDVAYNVTVEAAYGAYDALIESGETVLAVGEAVVEGAGEAIDAATSAYHAAAEYVSDLFSDDDG